VADVAAFAPGAMAPPFSFRSRPQLSPWAPPGCATVHRQCDGAPGAAPAGWLMDCVQAGGRALAFSGGVPVVYQNRLAQEWDSWRWPGVPGRQGCRCLGGGGGGRGTWLFELLCALSCGQTLGAPDVGMGEVRTWGAVPVSSL